jgi:exonuclease III
MDVRIGTWNLDHARAQKHDAARLQILREVDADVLVLTETNDRVALPGYSAVHSAPRPNAAPGGRWVTVWSRLPVIEPVEVADSNRACAARLSTTSGEAIIFGVVVPWHADVGEPAKVPRPRAWEEHHRAWPKFGEEWSKLRRKWPEAPLFVAGDLNISLGGPRYYGTSNGRRLFAGALEAAGLRCATEFEHVPEGALMYPAIDHILVPEHTKSSVVGAWEGRLQGLRLSDHSGLVVEVA